MMQKEVGKVFNNGRTWVLCSGLGKSDNVFSGFVVKQLDPTSEHQTGYYSSDWTDNLFKYTDETKSQVSLPDPKLIDSMSSRYRHDFVLLTEDEKVAIRTTMIQLWEEVVGLGFYKKN